jgi:hypothetical protein
VRQEHVASLGSIKTPLTVTDRIAFWARLHERLARLGNRVDGAAQGKVLAAVHGRVPMVTADERQALQLENAKLDAKQWSSIHDLHAGTVEDHKRHAAKVAGIIANAEHEAEQASAHAKAARERVERIERGENVEGGLGKPADFEQIVREAGWTTRDITHARLIAALPEEVLPLIVDASTGAAERAGWATARRLARELAQMPDGDEVEDTRLAESKAREEATADPKSAE